jgi:chorismate synthase
MRFFTAGESHGKGLSVIIDNFPAGVPLSIAAINHELARRQEGYGRGGRMHIEKDKVDFRGGVRFEVSTGAPIAIFIENRDFKNWEAVMSAEGPPTEEADHKKFVRPRPGHADLAGFYKYGHHDLRDVLERSSARETAARVATGAVAKELLKAFGIELFSHVIALGGIRVPLDELTIEMEALKNRAAANDLRCGGSEETLQQMRSCVDDALKEGTTLGGDIEIIGLNIPPGLGSYVQWDRKLDGLLAQAVMSIQAVKSVSIGAGDLGGMVTGSEFHDEISLQSQAVSSSGEGSGLSRPSNRAGGLEGGVTNGMPLVIKAVMKPIATMRKALASVNLDTGESESAHFERSDITAVPACGVICEAMVAIVLAKALLEKFGHDQLGDILASYHQYQARLSPYQPG